MTDNSLELTLLEKLHTPTPELTQFSFCKGVSVKALEQWVDALPLTRTRFISAILYSAVPEFARLKTDDKTRLDLLEVIRPLVQGNIIGLEKAFLNQPLILPDEARKAATVAQALQKHLSNGYLAAVRDSLSKSGDNTRQALAIHRAITGLGLFLLRGYQLYTPTPKQAWRELHTLYWLAERRGLTHTPVTDPLPAHHQVKTINHAYLRIVLLAACRPNQLRQNDLYSLYLALQELAPQARIEAFDEDNSSAPYGIILDSDKTPIYRSRLALYGGTEIRQLGTGALCQTLLEMSRDERQMGGVKLSSTLINHAVSAWGKPAQRHFERSAGEGQMEVTIGLTNLHFYLADETPFNLFINQSDNPGLEGDNGSIFQHHGVKINPHKQTPDDPWGNAFDVAKPNMAIGTGATGDISENIRRNARARYRGQHPISVVNVIDTSAGGFCLEWRTESPKQLKAGEILGLREQGRLKWAIAAVRWVQQTRNATQLGVQLLAPQAHPAAAAVVQKTGDYAEYLRVLSLPALRIANQPASLLTNALSFRETQKLKLLRSNNTVETVQLTRRLISTGTISQFTYKTLNSTANNDADHQNKTDFSAVWRKK